MRSAMKRVLAVMRKDLQTGRRESIVTYIVISPLLLAFGFRLLLPVLEGPSLTWALDEGLPDTVIAAFEEAGAPEVLPGRDAVRDRVMRIDDVVGVVSGADGLPEVWTQGNEARWVQEVPGLILDAAASPLGDVQWESLGGTASRLRYILAAMLAFTVLLMGGIAIGFLILEEKESGTLRVFTTSPVSFGEYLAAKVAGVLMISLPLGWAATYILLGQLPFVPLAVASVAGLPVALLLGFVIATFAQDQVAAIALLKSLLFFFTSLPLAGFFVSGVWAWALVPFSNHHAIQALYVAVQPGGGVAWSSVGLGLLTGLPLVALVVAQMRRRLGFGAGAGHLLSEPT